MSDRAFDQLKAFVARGQTAQRAAMEAGELALVDRLASQLLEVLATAHALDAITGDHARYLPLCERFDASLSEARRLARHLRNRYGTPTAGTTAGRGGGGPS